MDEPATTTDREAPSESPLRVLFLQNDADAVAIEIEALHDMGLDVEHRVAQSLGEFKTAVIEERWDVIVADNDVGDRRGRDALDLAKVIAPAIPVVVVSGTPGEDLAVETMRAGADDYVLKRDPQRLAAAVQRQARSRSTMADPAGTPRAFAIGQAFAVVNEVKDYAIYVIDPEGRILTWNEGAHAIKGYASEEILGQNFSRFFTEEARLERKPQRLLARAAADGRLEDEGWRVRKDGTLFWADVVITAMHDAQGRLRGFTKVTRDLTERRHAEDLLRQSEERLRLLIESVGDYAIYMLDPDGRITTWNTGAERIKGYRASEVLGRHFSTFFPPESSASRNPEDDLRIAAEQGCYEEEGWRIGNNGKRYWGNVVITAIRDRETGTLRGYAVVTRDLTDRRRIEEQARAAMEQAVKERLRAEQAQEAIQQRDEFISVAAHELRTPLTALILKLQSVTRALRKAETNGNGSVAGLADRLDGAFHQIERLTGLVERLLDVSRIVQGKLVMLVEPTNLAEIVRRVVDDFREPALAAGSELRYQCSGEVFGMWDGARIEQVIVNLLSNAVKYGNGNPIDVALTTTESGARLSVTDRGIGIAPEDVERIFTRFERAAPIRHFGGLGLGLYITRNIVQAHSGTIDVSSEPGHGTTFVIDLPARPSMEMGPALHREVHH